MRDEGLRRGTIEKIIKVIRNSHEHAIDLELISKNVVNEFIVWNESRGINIRIIS